MNAKTACLLIYLLFLYPAIAQVKRPLIIGRTSGSITLDGGKSIRVFGFAGKLSEKPGLPGTTIEATVGDSLEIDFWNVSQGDPHDIKIGGITPEKQNQRLAADADKAIRHMEHGYYSFVASRPGTYIYYCPVNYPFNIQAGMFGLLVVKNNHDNNTQIKKEQLWCSYEIDTNWHTDAVMDAERGERPMMEEKLVYRPQYFLINGRTNAQLSGTATKLNARAGTTVLLRLANAGFMQDVITFPKELALQVLTKNGEGSQDGIASNTILLKPLETCEVLVRCDIVYNGFVSYGFKNEDENKLVQLQKIPVSITK